MTEVSKDAGVIAVLAKRMVEERLPKALAIKARVDKGEVLNDLDLAFLEQIVEDAPKLKPLMDKDARVRDAAATMLGLYKEITARALENEKAGK